ASPGRPLRCQTPGHAHHEQISCWPATAGNLTSAGLLMEAEEVCDAGARSDRSASREGDVSDGGLYRIYRDRKDGAWFADGVYD
ncbi:MAG: hypothetical protein ACRDGM_06705, partial [bacterium]